MDYTFLSRFIYIYFASVSYVFAVIMFIIEGFFFLDNEYFWKSVEGYVHFNSVK